jgi:hypothetical protein
MARTSSRTPDAELPSGDPAAIDPEVDCVLCAHLRHDGPCPHVWEGTNGLPCACRKSPRPDAVPVVT